MTKSRTRAGRLSLLRRVLLPVRSAPLYIGGKRPTSVVDKLRAEEDRVDRAKEKLAEQEDELREAAA